MSKSLPTHEIVTREIAEDRLNRAILNSFGTTLTKEEALRRLGDGELEGTIAAVHILLAIHLLEQWGEKT